MIALSGNSVGSTKTKLYMNVIFGVYELLVSKNVQRVKTLISLRFRCKQFEGLLEASDSITALTT